MPLTQTELDDRFLFALDLISHAGAKAMGYFEQLATLEIKSKGPQDVVSEADFEVELLIKDAIAKAYPGDAFFGEETGPTDFADDDGIWVVDPIDGTQPFLMGMRDWCISIAFIHGGQKQIGLIFAPAANELFAAQKGKGATLNGRPIHVRDAKSLNDGIVSVGYSPRTKPHQLLHMMRGLLEAGGMYHRNGSGALSITNVAAGRLLGYFEFHINAWDCLAALLIVEEAGGRVNDFIGENGLHSGGKLVASVPAIFEQLRGFLPED